MEHATVDANKRFTPLSKRVYFKLEIEPGTVLTLEVPKKGLLEQLKGLPKDTPFVTESENDMSLYLGKLVRSEA